ncbi:MAG: hypothetical protein MUO68_23735 [Desulfobacteraceae bacterium]|jgi:hypothetical protein|nr:hypothetical protein [Desulfobacteraceae bacterium]
MRYSISPTMKLNDPGSDYEYKEREDNIMASKEKAARLEQRVHWEEKLNQRLSLMADKGAESEKIAKDTTVRKLRAKMRETGKRLRAIEEKEKKLAEMAKVKAEKLAAPKKEKKREISEEKPAKSKRQQKKKEKKQSKDKG